ncbi:hypothetical protein [Nocardia sp. NPDC047038]|uniref:hypothetical protein n=1 Tax=Nocardia sp. NPDC047038 TaxID=3154338 RepID=UPI003409481D
MPLDDEPDGIVTIGDLVARIAMLAVLLHKVRPDITQRFIVPEFLHLGQRTKQWSPAWEPVADLEPARAPTLATKARHPRRPTTPATRTASDSTDDHLHGSAHSSG